MKISIIYTTFNADSYDSVVKSVENQDVKDYELIVVSDYDVPHKIDNMVIVECDKKDDINARRAAGVAAANGEYISYIGDYEEYEYYHCTLLKTILDSLSDVDVVYGGARIYYRADDEIEASEPVDDRLFLWNKAALIKTTSKDQNFIFPSDLMHRKRCLDTAIWGANSSDWLMFKMWAKFHNFFSIQNAVTKVYIEQEE